MASQLLGLRIRKEVLILSNDLKKRNFKFKKEDNLCVITDTAVNKYLVFSVKQSKKNCTKQSLQIIDNKNEMEAVESYVHLRSEGTSFKKEWAACLDTIAIIIYY